MDERFLNVVEILFYFLVTKDDLDSTKNSSKIS